MRRLILGVVFLAAGRPPPWSRTRLQGRFLYQTREIPESRLPGSQFLADSRRLRMAPSSSTSCFGI